MDGDPFPALPVPEVASPAGVSFVPNCNLSPPSSLPPAVSHSGDSTDASRGADPLSRGERETWSRSQHFGNSPARERDPAARGGGGGTPGCGTMRKDRAHFHGLVVFRDNSVPRLPPPANQSSSGSARGAGEGSAGGIRGVSAQTSAGEVAINYPGRVVR